MNVEVWSDIGCPFCYIGKRHLEAALEQFPHRQEVIVNQRSFQLDPRAPTDYPGDLYDMLSKKFGQDREAVIQMNQRLTRQAASAGVDLQFDRVVPTNSYDAHRLVKFAQSIGKDEALLELLYKAYFTEGRHTGQKETLADIALQAGLDREAAMKVLNNAEYADEVLADRREAARLGATGVPFFVINGKHIISGAQPIAVFVEALEKAWNEQR